MIEAAVILSGVLRHWPDFCIILVLLLANATVGFSEEHQAGKAIDALKAQLAVKCRVRRDGTWVTPASRELVPGDVIRMRMGDIVPADARLLAGDPVEELAGVDVLCSDKTGTLTQNKLTLGDPFAVTNVTATQVILSAALASRADDDDAIDLAVLGGLDAGQALAGYQVAHFEPFDAVRKRTEATVRAADGSTFKVAKGAPQVIMALSAGSGQVKAAVDQAVGDFAARGFRSLGVARAEGEGPWQFLGVLPLFDPPRTDAKATIATARQLGVAVKMVTGDQVAIAVETAKTLGMGTNILDAAGLGDAGLEETKATAESIENADGFAQVFPEHKFHIVDVLQKRGHIVGMTGDGVNDAPALKKADCGIAVSAATDAARAAASIVLMKPGLSVIIDAVKESRRIVQRMNSYAIYRIAETLRVLLFVTLAILIFNFFPVTAVMIVVLALLNDGSILSIAYDNVHYKKQPEAWNMRLVIGMATVLGVVGPIAAFGLFYLGDRVYHLNHAHLQTLMYLMLSVAGSLTIYLTRTRGPFWSIRPARILVLAVTGAELIATLLAVYGIFMTPIGWRWALAVWGYAIIWFLLTDRVKLAAYRVLDPVNTNGAARPGTPAAEPASPADLPVEAAPAAKAPRFHTGTDPGDPVYHDSSDCPYGQEIKRGGNDTPGTGGRRRCDWCARHAVRA